MATTNSSEAANAGVNVHFIVALFWFSFFFFWSEPCCCVVLCFPLISIFLSRSLKFLVWISVSLNLSALAMAWQWRWRTTLTHSSQWTWWIHEDTSCPHTCRRLAIRLATSRFDFYFFFFSSESSCCIALCSGSLLSSSIKFPILTEWVISSLEYRSAWATIDPHP